MTRGRGPGPGRPDRDLDRLATGRRPSRRCRPSSTSTAVRSGAWAPAPHLEVSLLVARGYRVILPNIRGSATYGGAWIRPQLGDWGGVDAADVHAALDHVIELGLADPDRLGVLGLSYGGFMVNWLVGTSDRFRAAVSENGVTNQVSDWANSDTGPEYSRDALLGDPLSPEGVEKLWRQSPLRHVANIRTPLLMLQARGRPALPAARQRAAVHRAPEPGPDRRVRPLPGRVPRLRHRRAGRTGGSTARRGCSTGSTATCAPDRPQERPTPDVAS